MNQDDHNTPKIGCVNHDCDKCKAQQPVAYVYEREVDGFGLRKDVKFLKPVEVGADLYTSPPQDALVSALYSKINYLRGKIELLESGLVQAKRTWRELTDEERRETINHAWNEYVRGSVGDDSFSWCLSQAIEAKLKEKNQ